MRIFLVLAGLLLTASLTPAEAADAGFFRRPAAVPQATVYRVIPRSPEASLVWAADTCWRGCAHDCGRQFQACIAAGAEGCISGNNACDRYCQRECRIYGGPWLPLD